MRRGQGGVRGKRFGSAPYERLREHAPPRLKAPRSRIRRVVSSRLPMPHALQLIRLVALRQPTVPDLTRRLAISRATLFRLFRSCQRDLAVTFDCQAGRFSILDWGILDRRKVLQ